MRTGTTEIAADGVAAAPAVEAAAAMVAAGVEELARAVSASGSLGEWLAVVGACQAGMNRLAAVQDVAVAAAARVEPVWCEDGTLGEVVHGPGRVALDAVDLVAPLLGASHHRAQVRVEDAVRLTGWDPVPLDVTAAAPARSGLEGLHAAMRDGRLDGYRASVVASGPVRGTVQFFDGDTPIGEAVELVDGVATLNHAFTSVGGHRITAVYSGAAGLQGSSAEARTVDVTSGASTAPGGPTGTGSLAGLPFGS